MFICTVYNFVYKWLYSQAFPRPVSSQLATCNTSWPQKCGELPTSKAVHRRGGGVIFCFFKQSLCDRKVLIVVGFPILKVSQPETSFPRVWAERSEEDELTVSAELGSWIEVVPTDPFLSERPDQMVHISRSNSCIAPLRYQSIYRNNMHRCTVNCYRLRS